MNKDKMLALLSHYKYGTPFHNGTVDATIVALEELAFLRGWDTNKYRESVPDGTTHVDLNDSTDSKWIKLESSGSLRYYTDGDWISLTPTDHGICIVTLEVWRSL